MKSRLVTDYRAVMDLVLKGWSVRQITATMGCSHSTVQKVRQVLQAEQLTTTAQIAGLNDEAVAVLFHDGRSTGQGVFVPIDFDSVVKARTGRHKTTLQVLWGKYTSTPALPGQRYQDPWSVHLGGRFHRHGLCWLAR
ncbi:helix-turn-helix domain-containing protein [Corynebacterium belfantii]|uniref:Helix-turn-helix domain-containing protein n=1 Tax=Corynebacterium belfantii TaxID=2014537 RepID=A0ABS0LEG8_9CORY|nr:helix-turn-helix domain-containing protein [Corynebacterium belfantii]